MAESGRRGELAGAAADFVLERGLLGLSLRPLAAALGTSDRMLIYHFGDKDTLVAEALERINERAVARLSRMPGRRSVRAVVLALWRASREDRVVVDCLRVWLQAAGLGLLGVEPYRRATRRSNALWLTAVADQLRAAGASPAAARRAARLVSASLMGLLLDDPVEEAADVRRSVRDLADWAQRMCG